MTLITPIFDRIELLPFFFDYYRARGITRFVAGLWNGYQNPLFPEVAREFDHVRPSAICPIEAYNGPSEVAGLNLIRREFIRPTEWFAIADLDEFIAVPGTFAETTQKAAADGFVAVHGRFLDRVAGDGGLPRLNCYRSLDEQFPIGCRIAQTTTADCNKAPFARGDIPITSGHHNVDKAGPVWKDGAVIHHFKWTAGVLDRTKDRYRYFTQQNLPWREESREYIERLTPGKVDLSDPRYEATPTSIGI